MSETKHEYTVVGRSASRVKFVVHSGDEAGSKLYLQVWLDQSNSGDYRECVAAYELPEMLDINWLSRARARPESFARETIHSTRTHTGAILSSSSWPLPDGAFWEGGDFERCAQVHGRDVVDGAAGGQP